MVCSSPIFPALLGACAMSMLLCTLHTTELQTVFRAAVEYASGRKAVSAPRPDVGANARASEINAFQRLNQAFAGEGGAAWATWFGSSEAADDASEEDAVRLLLKEAETLEQQWRFKPAEVKLRDAFKKSEAWLASLRKNEKPSAQRDRALFQAIDVHLQMGKFQERRGRSELAVATLRIGLALASSLAQGLSESSADSRKAFMADLKADHSAEVVSAQVRSQAGLARMLCRVGGRQGKAVKEARSLFIASLSHKQSPRPQLEAQVHADFAECLHREGALSEAREGLRAVSRVLADPSFSTGWKDGEREKLEKQLARLQGSVSHDDGAFGDAVKFYSKFLEMMPESIDELPPLEDVLDRLEIMQDMSLALASLGKMPEAFSSIDDVDRLQKSAQQSLQLKSHSKEPVQDNHLQASIARSLIVRTELELERSRAVRHRPSRETKALSERAVALLRKASASAEDLENALNTLGNVQMSLGESSNAIGAYNEAVKLAMVDHGKDSPLVAALYHNLASAMEGLGKLSEAVELYKKALDIQVSTLGEANPDTAGTLGSLARCLSKSGLRPQALDAAQKAAVSARAAFPEGHWMRREAERRLLELKPPAALASSKEFLVSAREVHRIAS